MESKKLKKKDSGQKQEKRKIAKQIKALKALIGRSGEEMESDSE